MILSKYATAFLQLAIVALAALQTAQEGGVAPTEAWQLAGLVVGAAVTYFVPILEGPWAAALKVGGAVLGAILAAIVPFATGGWSAEAAIIIALAGLNALAAQVGVSIRVDAAAEAISSPIVANAMVEAVDPKAASVAYAHQVH